MILFAFVANMWVFALRFSAVYPPVVSVAWLPWLLLVICWFDICVRVVVVVAIRVVIDIVGSVGC